MSLHLVDQYLSFAEQVAQSRESLPDEIDPTELENVLVNLGVVVEI